MNFSTALFWYNFIYENTRFLRTKNFFYANACIILKNVFYLLTKISTINLIQTQFN